MPEFEKTVVKTLELPYGQDWVLFPDANVVALSPHLDCTGRKRALLEVAEHWRRTCLEFLPPEPPPEVPRMRTQPLTTLTPVPR